MATDDYAIIVGINDYNPADFAPLQGAKNDANAFLDWVKSPIGGDVPADHVDPFVSLSDPHTRVPRYSDLLQMINKVAAQAPPNRDYSRIGRRLYLYFAGHGYSAGDFDETEFVALDQPGIVLPTLPGRCSANTFARAVLFDEIILFMDCCRVHHQTLRGSHINSVIYEDATGAGRVNRFFVFATPYGQVAREGPVNGSGVMRGQFSRVLLDGLNGAAVDCQGCITTKSLREHLEITLGRPEIDQRPKFASDDFITLVTGLYARTERVTVTLSSPGHQLEVLEGATFDVPNPAIGHTVLPNGEIELILPVDRTFLLRSIDTTGKSASCCPWKSDKGLSHVTL